jgi:hypothetical protein
LNGTVVDGSVINKSFAFQGYTDHAGEHVVLEVLSTPSADPSNDGNWVKFGEAWTVATPTVINGNTQNPLFAWSTNAVPVATGQGARWPSGGLIRTRARSIDAQNQSRVLTTFDSVSWGACLVQHLSAGDDWSVIGTDCNGLGGGMVAMASTLTSPATLPASLKPDWLGRKGDHADAEAQTYYDTWGAPKTLPLFKSQFGFPGGEVTATYYNDGDLGLGREMHCKSFAAGGGLTGVACYVTNYSGVDNTPTFDVDPNIVLADAIAHQHSFATVAMVYTPPANVENSVKFVVYKQDGTQALHAQLDSVGTHVSVPNNCLTCHGISSFYNDQDHKVNGNAKFLAFDPFAFKYSTQAGFTLNEQQEKFRQLNALIKLTAPTAAISQLIDGMYAPNAVTTPGAFANDAYVPDAWATANSTMAGTSAYLGIIKPGCRTCHASATNASLDFLEPDDWSPLIPTIRNDVCKKTAGGQRGHAMPQAERVSKKFWASGGRAYLMTGYAASPPDGLEACDP